jgi:hypothetical protein
MVKTPVSHFVVETIEFFQYFYALDSFVETDEQNNNRLGLDKNQMLYRYDESLDQRNRGIKLPFGFVPTACSILSEPTQDCSRSVVLLTSKSSFGIHFLICQLQITEEYEVMKVADGTKVAGTIACNETIIYQDLPSSVTFVHQSVVQSRYGVFLAGASFQFDFFNNGTSIQNDSHIIATLGILHNFGQTVTAVEVSSSHKSFVKSLFDLQVEASSLNKPSSIKAVEKIWMSDIIETSLGLEDAEKYFYINTTFAVSGGYIFVWSVALNIDLDKNKHRDPVVIGPLQLFPDDDPEKSNIFIGSLPSFVDQFLLYSTQEYRKCKRQIDFALFPSIISETISLYGVSDFVVGAPTLATSLLLALSKKSKFQMVRTCVL